MKEKVLMAYSQEEEDKIIKGEFYNNDIDATANMFRTLKKLGLIKVYWWIYHSNEFMVKL